jgi:hypothetical protein
MLRREAVGGYYRFWTTTHGQRISEGAVNENFAI